MRKLLIFVSLLSFSILACKAGEGTKNSVTFKLNGSEVSLAASEYEIKNDIIYFSTKALEKHFELEFKELFPGKQIGMCRDDLCIPVDVGEADKMTAYKNGQDYYVPLVSLFNDLGDQANWNAEDFTLDVTIAVDEGGIQLNQIKK
ncbi:hypothetical protein ACFL5P_02880 [candidate division KSB1 bacterium]